MDLNFSQCSQQTQRMESQFHSEIEENHKKTRKGNYSIEEDMALVRSWLHISEDAIVGRDQKSSKLWQRILDTFHQFLGKVIERNLRGLQNRWQTISHDVSKFCGHYNKIGRLNPSGWNDQLKFDEAKKQFGAIEGPLQAKPVDFYRFKFEHCWKILKDSPKWNEYVVVRNTTKAPKKAVNLQPLIIDEDNANSPQLSTPMSPCSLSEGVSQFGGLKSGRPEGRRKVKARRKRESKEDEGTMYLKSIDDTLKEATMIEKEKWEAKKKRVEQKALLQEMKVMSQSMEGLTAEQKLYWKFQQSMIVERYKANGIMPILETQNISEFNFDLNED